ncbi:MAG: hypothetical protein PUC65_03415 [Clostridiales bacterium]|nr:hypothetical protein [Clostridiales bacterium]
MIKDLKFAFKCMKYAYNKKMICGMSLAFIVLGGIQFCSGRPLNYIVGGYMLFAAPCLLCQMYQVTNMSKLVASSPKKRTMQIRILTLLNLLAVLLGFILFSFGMYIVYRKNQCPVESIGYIYIIQGVMDIIMLIYMAFSYKHYIISSIIFFCAFMAAFAGSIGIAGGDLSKFNISVPVGVGIAFVCILIGSFAFYYVSKLVYKAPMDKYAIATQLRSEI